MVFTLKDYNYWKHGCVELTLEISCCKFPQISDLEQLWYDNKESLISYMKLANIGVRGIINFQNNQSAKFVTVQINSIEPLFKTNELGEYYRLLLPGTYNLTILLDCTPVYSTTFQITPSELLTTLNITLNNEIFFKYMSVAHSLNQYATFCTDTRQPVPCTNYDSSNDDLATKHTTKFAFEKSGAILRKSDFLFHYLLIIFSLVASIKYN